MNLILEEIEKDIIKEIINISLAKAADSFAVISKDTVLINVPDLQVITQEMAVSEISKREEIKVIIHSEIMGDLKGNTLLLFNQEHVDKLAEVCLSKHFNEVDDIVKNSLLLEISNIITGTLVTQLANILKLNLYGSVPDEPIYPSEKELDNFRLNLSATRSFLVTIHTEFINHKNKVGLPLMIIFDIQNLNKILELIRKNNYQNFALFKPDTGKRQVL